jgi:hypothetical protein
MSTLDRKDAGLTPKVRPAAVLRFLEHSPVNWNLIRRAAFRCKGYKVEAPPLKDQRMNRAASPENLPNSLAIPPGACACGFPYIPLFPRRRIEPTSPTSDPRDGST